MNIWANAFNYAYRNPADWSILATLMSNRRSGTVFTEEWLQTNVDEAFAHLMEYAPCKAAEWLSPAHLPNSLASILASILARSHSNPDGVRTVQMGEISKTFAGSVFSEDGPVTMKEAEIISRAAGCPDQSLQYVTVTPTPVFGAA